MSCTSTTSTGSTTTTTTSCEYTVSSNNKRYTTCTSTSPSTSQITTSTAPLTKCSGNTDTNLHLIPDSKDDFIARFDILAQQSPDENTKNQYIKLNNDINTRLQQISSTDSLNTQLNEIGRLQQSIISLEKKNDEMDVDVESAIARDNILRSKDTDITHHTLFLLDRPIRKKLIPYLWVVSVLFIGVALIIFKMTMPTIIFGGSFFQVLKGVFTDKRVLGSLLGAALIVILFLSLKIAGVFGK